MPKCTCANPGAARGNGDITDWFPGDDYIKYNLNETMCEDMGGDWSCFQWNGEQPECVDSYWSKVRILYHIFCVSFW